MLGSLLGGIASSALSLFGKNKEAKMQKQFAKNGIQWKVEDAKKAGVHPLYALGANTVSYSPVGVGDSFGWLSDMGQEIDRSRMATSGRETRRMEAALGSLSLERAGLENDLLRAEIAKTRGQVGPPVPAGGRGLVPEDLVKPQRTDGLNIGVGVSDESEFCGCANRGRSVRGFGVVVDGNCAC